MLADAGRPVVVWARREEIAAGIREQRRNPEYLPGALLPASVTATSNAGEALDGADLVAIAVPSQTLRENLAGWQASGAIHPDATLVSLMKGIELGTGKRMSEVIADALAVDPGRVAVITGPNLAGEIAFGQPTAAVVACPDMERATVVQQAVATPYFRPYTNDDVIGCELGGAVKNVIALACGMAIGMGFGDNTKATLITRGLAETARLGVRAGRRPAHVRRAGRAGRPRRHLHVAAVAQPDVRRAPGPRGEPGAGAGGDPADGRGRQELSVHSRPRPRPRGRDADHRTGRAGLPRGGAAEASP